MLSDLFLIVSIKEISRVATTVIIKTLTFIQVYQC